MVLKRYLFNTCLVLQQIYFFHLEPCLNETDSGWVWFGAGLVVTYDNGGALGCSGLWFLSFEIIFELHSTQILT